MKTAAKTNSAQAHTTITGYRRVDGKLMAYTAKVTPDGKIIQRVYREMNQSDLATTNIFGVAERRSR